MDNLPIEIGDCFLFDNDEDGRHMHIVIAEDRENPYGQVFLVYITSAERIFDNTTIFEPGIHEFIKKRSWVKYDNTQIMLRSELRSRIIKRYTPLKPEYIEKIQKGVLDSKHTQQYKKEIFKQWQNESLFRKIDKQ